MKAQSSVAHATSLPSSTVHNLQEKTLFNVLNKMLCMLTVTVVSYL